MVTLTDEELQFVRETIKKNGITMPGLDCDLIDHLLCSIEAHMTNGRSFSEAFSLAYEDLNGRQPIADIQQETVAILHEHRNVSRNLLVYLGTLVMLIGIPTFFTYGINPAIILTCSALIIFYIYHAVFQNRKTNTVKSNVILFTTITLIPVTFVLLFLAKEFRFQLWGTTGWSLLVISIAIPVYSKAVKDVLQMDRTITTLICYALRFAAMVCLLWVPLVLSIRLFRPEVSVSFLNDFLCLSGVSFIASIGFKQIGHLKIYLKKT